MVVMIIKLNWLGVEFVVLLGVYVLIDVIGFGLFGYMFELVCGV